MLQHVRAMKHPEGRTSGVGRASGGGGCRTAGRSRSTARQSQGLARVSRRHHITLKTQLPDADVTLREIGVIASVTPVTDLSV